MYEEKLQVKQVSAPHLDLAGKMAGEIMQMSPAQQNDVVKYITEQIKCNRNNEIDHKTKEVEELKSLNTEI